MSQSMDVGSLERSNSKYTNQGSGIKLPTLRASKDLNRLQPFGKRFNSVKTREYLNQTKKEEVKQPIFRDLNTTMRSVTEALPIALMRKQRILEKTEAEEDEEAKVKKLIKIRNPKEYHGSGIHQQDLLYGKVEENSKNPKITFGQSYVITVSPSQKTYEINRKKAILITKPIKITKDKEDFNILDQYENHAVCEKYKYKKVWHPVFCQSATLTLLNGTMYLIGGVSHTIIEQV